MAPLSLVETTISGGLVLLAWLAERWFGVRVGSREWLGLGLCAGGLALLAATSGQLRRIQRRLLDRGDDLVRGGRGRDRPALLLVSGSSGSSRRSSGPLLGVAAGLLLGVANVSVKA